MVHSIRHCGCAQKGGALHGRVVLPPTVSGTLRLTAGPRPLAAGETRF
jgi:hypothetical protein